MTIATRRPRPVGTRWDPFFGVSDLHEQMSRLLTDAFPDVSRIKIHAWAPPMDVEETDDAFVIEADMPGVRSEDVNVDVQGNELRITGEIQESERQGVLRRQSRRTGSFDYRIALPGEVNSEGCQADLDHGVLRLRLPKTAGAARRRIPVRSARAVAVSATGSGKKAAHSKTKAAT